MDMSLFFMANTINERGLPDPDLEPDNYAIEAINQPDFAIMRAMVFLGSMLYIVGLLLTDISYTLFDPTIRI